MNFLYPIISVAGEVLGKTVDKLNFNRNKIGSNELIFILFSTMVTGLLVSLLFIREPLPVISLTTGALVIVMILLSSGQNFFDFKGLSMANLSVREPIYNFKPILTSFLAFIIFPSEREIKYVLAIVAGSIILYLVSSNRGRKPAFTFDRGVIYFFLAVACSALLSNIYKFGLETVTPMYLLLFRTVGVLGFSVLFLRLNLAGLNRKQVGFGITGGLLYLIGNLAELYSIHRLGLNFTILILLLQPALIYILSVLVLKEKVQLRQVAASAALIAIIILVVYL